MTWLAVVLRRHSEPAEADLDRVYGIELADFYRGQISARALSVRLRHLPDGSALWRAIGDDRAWGDETYLVARAVDALQGANWQRGGSKGPQPKPVQRPADARVAKVRDIKNQARAARWLAKNKKPDGGEG